MGWLEEEMSNEETGGAVMTGWDDGALATVLSCGGVSELGWESFSE